MRQHNPLLGAVLAAGAMAGLGLRRADPEVIIIGEPGPRPAPRHRTAPRPTTRTATARERGRASFSPTPFDEERIARAAQTADRKAKARSRQHFNGTSRYHPLFRGEDGLLPYGSWVHTRYEHLG